MLQEAWKRANGEEIGHEIVLELNKNRQVLILWKGGGRYKYHFLQAAKLFNYRNLPLELQRLHPQLLAHGRLLDQALDVIIKNLELLWDMSDIMQVSELQIDKKIHHNRSRRNWDNCTHDAAYR